jgi:hypothetical protein
MAMLPPRQRRSLQAILWIAVACLFVSQSLNNAMSPHYSGRSHADDRSLFLTSADPEQCSKADMNGGSHIPSEHDHSRCWAQCCQGGGRQNLTPFVAFIAAITSVAALAPDETGGDRPTLISSDQPRPGSGWASSWSSRAPPLFL